jgi:hypothetical protein
VVESAWLEVLVAVTLFGAMFLPLELSYRLGYRRKVARGDGAQLGPIQGAVLGLLALLLGFSFAGATSRFVARQDLIVSEANAIGTAYFRADLLDEPYRRELRELLRTYTAVRIAWFNEMNLERQASLGRDAERLHPRIFQAAAQGVERVPQFAVVVLQPVNEVIDLHTARISALWRHLPLLVIAALVVCAALGLVTVGYSCGLARRRSLVFSYALGLLIAAALWMTIDLDYPRRGLMRVNQQPMIDLQATLSAEATDVVQELGP